MLLPEVQASLDLLMIYTPLLIQAAVILLVAWLGVRLVRVGTRRLRKRLQGHLNGGSGRLVTLLSLAAQIARVVIILLTIFTILGTFGVNLGPIIASLGVIGLAVSLGAQTLIKDYFGGLMILIENQYTVGDWVTIAPVSGTVERLSLRLTTLRDVNGKLHIIPNGDVRIVTNSSRDWSLAIVELNLALDTNVDHALEVLVEATQQAAEEESLAGALLDQPEVQGWSKLMDWAVQVRLSARTRPGNKIETEIALRRYALDALLRAGVRLARPVVERLEDRN